MTKRGAPVGALKKRECMKILMQQNLGKPAELDGGEGRGDKSSNFEYNKCGVRNFHSAKTGATR